MIIERRVFRSRARRRLHVVLNVGQAIARASIPGRGQITNHLPFAGAVADECAQSRADNSQNGASATDPHHELAAVERCDRNGFAGLGIGLGLGLGVRQIIVDPVGCGAPYQECDQHPDQLDNLGSGGGQVDLLGYQHHHDAKSQTDHDAGIQIASAALAAIERTVEQRAHNSAENEKATQANHQLGRLGGRRNLAPC